MSRMFAARTDTASFGNTATLTGASSCSLAFWIYFDSVANTATGARIWSKFGGSSGTQSWLIGEGDGAGADLVFGLRNSGGAILVALASGILYANRWMHLACIFHGGTTVSIWRNGISQTVSYPASNTVNSIQSTTAIETFGQDSASNNGPLAKIEFAGAWKNAVLSAGEIGRLAAGADPADIRQSACVALPTFNRQGVVYDRKRKVVIKPSGTRPFRDPPRIVRRRVIGLDLGTSPPPPPPSNTNYLMPMLGVGDD